MRVNSIRMQNFRSFVDSGDIELDTVNVLFGANNSGKSSVLRGLHQLQLGVQDQFGDVRVGSPSARVHIDLSGIHEQSGWMPPTVNQGSVIATITTPDRRSGSWTAEFKSRTDSFKGDFRLPNVDPQHFVVPFLSRRKAASYREDIREQFVHEVLPDVGNLAARLSRLGNSSFPAHDAYAQACRDILGFVVTTVPSASGQRPGVYLPDQQTVPIEQMGEGVPNIVHLLASLAISKNKLFLVEEPENDLHPSALRALLDLMVESSRSNQFVVSTHSNIVVRHLCAAPRSSLFRVTTPFGVLPQESTVERVSPTPEARLGVLRELGYEFSDFDLWDGWLILEESSAERVIRDYLIPWFAPRLARVRTFAAGGVDRVEAALEDFLRLVTFTHLQPAYSGRTWVRVDGDERGQSVVSGLRGKMSDWPAGRIAAFEFGQFELNYPPVFAEKVRLALSVSDKQARRRAKQDLLAEVRGWLDEDPQRGRAALEESARGVIADLRQIEAQM